MRALIPVLCLVAAGCGTPANPPPDQERPAPAAPDFDPDSAEKTADWAATRAVAMDRAPANDPVARKEALEKYRAAVGAAEGKAVRWEVPVGKVNVKAECCIHLIAKQLPAASGESLQGRNFALVLIPAAQWPPEEDVGKMFAATPDVGFPPSPPNSPWLKSLAEWDTVTLVGKVVKVSASPRGVLLGLDGHVQKP